MIEDLTPKIRSIIDDNANWEMGETERNNRAREIADLLEPEQRFDVWWKPPGRTPQIICSPTTLERALEYAKSTTPGSSWIVPRGQRRVAWCSDEPELFRDNIAT